MIKKTNPNLYIYLCFFLSLYASDNPPRILRIFFRTHQKNPHDFSDESIWRYFRKITNVSHDPSRNVGSSEEWRPSTIVFSRGIDLHDSDDGLSWERPYEVFDSFLSEPQSSCVPLHPDVGHLHLYRFEDSVSTTSKRSPLFPPHLLEKRETATTCWHRM